MVNQFFEVVWDDEALDQFYEIYEYIRKDSYLNAERIREKVFDLTDELERMPTRYNPDKMRLDKNPNFRAFEVDKTRISYFIDESVGIVKIVRTRSVRQKPLEY